MGGPLRTRYVTANVTTTAGTTTTAPLVTAVNLGNLILLSAHLRIPSGHAGLTGWRVDYSTMTIIPFSAPSAYIIGDDEQFEFEVNYEVGNTLQVVTYNTDVYDHTHYLTLKVTELPARNDGIVVPLTITPGG